MRGRLLRGDVCADRVTDRLPIDACPQRATNNGANRTLPWRRRPGILCCPNWSSWRLQPGRQRLLLHAVQQLSRDTFPKCAADDLGADHLGADHLPTKLDAVPFPYDVANH